MESFLYGRGEVVNDRLKTGKLASPTIVSFLACVTRKTDSSNNNKTKNVTGPVRRIHYAVINSVTLLLPQQRFGLLPYVGGPRARRRRRGDADGGRRHRHSVSPVVVRSSCRLVMCFTRSLFTLHSFFRFFICTPDVCVWRLSASIYVMRYQSASLHQLHYFWTSPGWCSEAATSFGSKGTALVPPMSYTTIL